jgi:hypothetical protein
MPELELALVELGRSIEFPPTPDLAARVRERIAAERAPRRRVTLFPGRRALVVALAVLAVAVGALMAVPGTRAAILEFFGLKGITIERVESLPTVPKNANLANLGERMSLDQARGRVDFEVVVPEALGEPDEVYYSDFPPGGMVSFVYGSAEEPRALLTQFRASVDEFFFKKVTAGTEVETVTVGGRPGFYLSGEPHVFGYVDAEGQFRQETVRLVGNVLLWERGDLTLRLEGDITKTDALRIARSMG